MYTALVAATFGVLAAAAPSYPSCKDTTRSQPFSFPLPDGFPNTFNPAVLTQQAHGYLPNGALPSSISDTSATLLEVIATTELFEVAYFYDLVQNMTSCVEGYRVGDPGIMDIKAFDRYLHDLEVIIGQEKLHATGANAILASAGRPTILPCEYMFPPTTFLEALIFAQTFTDLVLGTLQSVIYDFSTDGDVALGPLIASIIGNEAEQVGWMRVSQVPKRGKVPSANPFLTAASGAFAYSALNQLVLVSGTCPNASDIAVPVFSPLSITTADPTNETTSLDFSVDGTFSSGMSLVYINQQNLPEVYTPTVLSSANGVTTFSAPFNGSTMFGFTIAAVTSNAGPFTNATDVAASTVYGPGLVELN